MCGGSYVCHWRHLATAESLEPLQNWAFGARTDHDSRVRTRWLATLTSQDRWREAACWRLCATL